MSYFVNLGLTSEQLEKLEEIVNEKYVQKRFYDKLTEDFEELNDKFKQTKKDHEQLLKNGKDSDKLQNELESIKSELNQSKIDHDNELKKVKIDYAVLDRLKNEGARNVKVIQPLLDYNQISIDDQGSILGIEDQIKSLKGSEETSFLFHDSNYSGHNGNEKVTNHKRSHVVEKDSIVDPFSEKLSELSKALHSPQ